MTIVMHMNVPFISSGAMNKIQYSLVRKVESAAAESDQYLILEVHAIRERFSRPSLSLVRRVIFNVILSRI
jgi:AP-4 complex subunit epsilon-1